MENSPGIAGGGQAEDRVADLEGGLKEEDPREDGLRDREDSKLVVAGEGAALCPSSSAPPRCSRSAA